MSQPPFNPGSVHTEDEFAQTEVPQDSNGDPVWDTQTQARDFTPNCPKCGHIIQRGELNCPRCGYGEYKGPLPSGLPHPEDKPQAGNPLNLQQQWHPEQNQPLQSAQEASQIAGAALHLCDSNNIDLNGKLYLKIEAWTGIAGIAGSVPGIETVKDNVLGGVPGITARSSLKNASGKLLSEAEGFVGQDESFWASKPVSDRVNMAQTRAVGRVCRLVYSYIVQIMNKEYGRRFEMTPAEEILASQRQAAAQPQQPPQMGTRQPFVPQNTIPFQQPAPAWQPPQMPPQTQVYQNPQAYPAPQPNVQQPVGQDEVWQGQLRHVEKRYVQNKMGGTSDLYIMHLTDGRSASTFDKTIAGHLMNMPGGQNVELQVKPRGQGRYNVQQIRPL